MSQASLVTILLAGISVYSCCANDVENKIKNPSCPLHLLAGNFNCCAAGILRVFRIRLCYYV